MWNGFLPCWMAGAELCPSGLHPQPSFRGPTGLGKDGKETCSLAQNPARALTGWQQLLKGFHQDKPKPFYPPSYLREAFQCRIKGARILRIVGGHLSLLQMQKGGPANCKASPPSLPKYI